MPYTDYANRLLNLHLPSLEHRMIYFDMVMCFKIINYSVDILFLRWCDPPHSCKLHVTCRYNFFTHRVFQIWNSLPDTVVIAPNVCVL